MDTVLRVLRHVDLFNGLSDAQLAGIAQHAERVVYQSGDVLIARDDACDAAILTVDGDAAVIRGTRNEPVEEPVLPGSILASISTIIAISARIEPGKTGSSTGSLRVPRITAASPSTVRIAAS
ncbi:MAG: hypothetical protein AAFR01_01520, partial [Pseudomonadota bacterium]